jgi:hypothetical protein
MKRRTIKKRSRRLIAEGRRWQKRYRGRHDYWWLQLYGLKIGHITGCAFYTNLPEEP